MQITPTTLNKKRFGLHSILFIDSRFYGTDRRTRYIVIEELRHRRIPYALIFENYDSGKWELMVQNPDKPYHIILLEGGNHGG